MARPKKGEEKNRPFDFPSPNKFPIRYLQHIQTKTLVQIKLCPADLESWKATGYKELTFEEFIEKEKGLKL